MGESRVLFHVRQRVPQEQPNKSRGYKSLTDLPGQKTVYIFWHCSLLNKGTSSACLPQEEENIRKLVHELFSSYVISYIQSESITQVFLN